MVRRLVHSTDFLQIYTLYPVLCKTEGIYDRKGKILIKQSDFYKQILTSKILERQFLKKDKRKDYLCGHSTTPKKSWYC
jgi:hypothetical protein